MTNKEILAELKISYENLNDIRENSYNKLTEEQRSTIKNCMNEYTICVTETLQRCITIKADTEEQAIDKVQEMYDNEEIVLDSSDFIETNIAKLEN